MAGSFSRTLKLLLLISTLLGFTEAREHLIGGKSNAWRIPKSESDSLNHWAEKSRFLVGDSLVWQYDGSKDSVLQVTKRDYVTCNTTGPIETFNDGNNTTVKLERSGPYYFISGAVGHCEKGQKVIVVVISENHWRVSPAPSPLKVAPAPAPANGGGRLGGGFLFVGLLGVLMFVV